MWPAPLHFCEVSRRTLELIYHGMSPHKTKNVARYALIILNKFFSQSILDVVPQFYTSSGKIPDLVLETYLHRGGQERSRVFAARVYIEFKSELNTKDAIKHVVESIDLEYGEGISFRGFLIDVKGGEWTIMDFHFVKTEDHKVELLYQKFKNIRFGYEITAKGHLDIMRKREPKLTFAKKFQTSLKLTIIRWISIILFLNMI